MAIDLSKLIVKFLDEAFELLDKLNKGVVRLEKKPEDMELINEIFRSAHTIKGSSRMMKLTAVTEVSHKLEDIFDALRSGDITVSKDLIDVVLDGSKVLRELLKQCGKDPSNAQNVEFDDAVLLDNLISVASGKAIKVLKVKPKKAVARKSSSKKTTKAGKAKSKEDEKLNNPESSEVMTSQVLDTVRVDVAKLDDTIKLIGEMVSSQSRLKERISDAVVIDKLVNSLIYKLERMDGRNEIDVFAYEELRGVVDNVISTSKRLVYTSKDDLVMTDLLASELQEQALKLRMVPLSGLFDKLEFSVREIAASVDKKVEFLASGADTEVDKKVIEMVEDPLMHMLRNSLDHGIEMSTERKARGKSEIGSITINALHEGGNVIIVIKDDGSGIDKDKVKARAVEKGLYTEVEIDELTDEAILNIIFEPGFTTSNYVTDISGRGVGMDVVKRNIVEELRGSVRIDSVDGEGTTFYITLPTSLSILRVLKISSRGSLFAIPVNFVSEIIKVKRSELIEVVDRHAVKLREEIIPVSDLAKILGVKRTEFEVNKGLKPSGSNIMIAFVDVGSERLGLIIDSIYEEEDMVVKPLPPLIKNLQMILGAIISGHDDVINVLHVPMIIKKAKETSVGKLGDKRVTRTKGKILVVDDSLNTREIEKSILESHGYSVDIAVDGLDGLSKIKSNSYDLVVTDVEMPNMDGFSLTEKIRSTSKFKDLPVIIVTSLEKKEDKERGLNVGASAYIVKGSFDQNNLLQTVHHLIG